MEMYCESDPNEDYRMIFLAVNREDLQEYLKKRLKFKDIKVATDVCNWKAVFYPDADSMYPYPIACDSEELEVVLTNTFMVPASLMSEDAGFTFCPKIKSSWADTYGHICFLIKAPKDAVFKALLSDRVL